jgi:hypothetical protein
LILAWFVFLVLDEESAALTHHLPVDVEVNCVLVSVIATGCRLVVVDSASRHGTFFDLLIKHGLWHFFFYCLFSK